MAKRTKTIRALNPKQQRLVKRLPLAASIAEAGRQVGYNTKQATYKALARIRRNAAELLTEMGYGQEIALADLVDMADAMQTKFFAHKGKVVSQRKVADNEIRFRARVELNKMHGHYPNPSDAPPTNNIGVRVVIVPGAPRPGGRQIMMDTEMLPATSNEHNNGKEGSNGDHA
jgi:hypothetical protein